MRRQGDHHFGGRLSEYRRRDKLACCEYPNIDPILSEKDVGEDNSEKAPHQYGDKPGPF